MTEQQQNQWRVINTTGSEGVTEYHFMDGDEPYHDEAVAQHLNTLTRQLETAKAVLGRIAAMPWPNSEAPYAQIARHALRALDPAASVTPDGAAAGPENTMEER